jgi:hypothetical protein
MARQIALQTKNNLIPTTAFTQLPYWKMLNADEQKVVERESQELARAMFHEGASKLEQGRHLAELQETLEPYRVFVRHLRQFKFSIKSAYRYIAYYNNAKRRYPESVLQAILARGIDAIGDSVEQPFGKYTPVIKALPIPKNADKYEIENWVNRVEEKYKEYRSDLRQGMPMGLMAGNPTPDTLMKTAFRHVRMRFKRVPKGQQQAWLKKLTGYLLAELGADSPVTINPTEAPEEFRRGPGKPRADGASA